MIQNRGNRVAAKRLFSIVNGSTPKSDVVEYWDGDITWITPEDLGSLDSATIASSRRGITNAGLVSCGTSMVPKGSIVLSTRAPIGAVALAGVPLCTNQGCKALVPRTSSIESRYFYYQFQSLQKELQALGNGSTFLELSTTTLSGVKLVAPEYKDQVAIADFLDRETAEADALVVDYERLLELLDERRIALITQAVTKGLDPKAQMKDSGVEWIDGSPKHWRVLRNKVLFQERDERSSSGDEELLSVSHLTGVTPRSDKTVNMFMAESLEGYKRCFKGDFVINTMWAWMGAMGTAPCDGIVSPSYNVYRVRDSKNLDAAYYDLLSRIPSHISKIKSISTGVWESRLRLYPEQFLNLVTCVPPITEQREIVAHIHSELQRNKEIALHMRSAIALLNERRQSLITAAVTGQIDVTTYKSDIAKEAV